MAQTQEPGAPLTVAGRDARASSSWEPAVLLWKSSVTRTPRGRAPVMVHTQLNEMRNASQTPSRVIIAREGTELADTLRATGWTVRAGWRTTTRKGQSVWHLRFEVGTESVSRS